MPVVRCSGLAWRVLWSKHTMLWIIIMHHMLLQVNRLPLAAPPPSSPILQGMMLVGLGAVVGEQGRHEEAEALLRRGLALCRKVRRGPPSTTGSQPRRPCVDQPHRTTPRCQPP